MREAHRREIWKMVEGDEQRSNRNNNARDRASAGQAAPPEAIAKQFAARQVMVELDEETSNQLFETLADWNYVLEAEGVDIRELSP